MTSDDYRLQIGPYLAGELTADERERFEQQLAASAELRSETEELKALWETLALLPEEQPNPAMRARFYQRLNAFDKQKPDIPAKRLHWNMGAWNLVPLALGLFIFALGIYVGRAMTEDRGQTAQVAQMSAQVQSLREMVALSLLDRQSATSRLEGVSWSSQVDRPNERLLAALLAALNEDSNVNVRLSSLNALERFTHNTEVRQALIDSIQRQDSPLVQIALIDSIVQGRNRAAEPVFKKLSSNTEVNPAVRQRAQWGIQKLNFE